MKHLLPETQTQTQEKGDTVLFGGNNTKDMKQKLEVPEKRPLADFYLPLPSPPKT